MLLYLILSVDVVLALVHVVVMVGWNAPDVWRVDMDGSYGEAYQYAKYLWLILLIVAYAKREHEWLLALWVPLIAYFLLDDALLVHERAGFWYASQEGAFGLGPISAQNVGELAVSALAGVALLGLLALGYARADARTRWIYRVMGVLVAALLVFAVVVDAVHGLVVDIRILDRSLGFIEDLGEMVVLTVLVVFAFRLNVSGGGPGFPDVDQVSNESSPRAAR